MGGAEMRRKKAFKRGRVRCNSCGRRHRLPDRRLAHCALRSTNLVRRRRRSRCDFRRIGTTLRRSDYRVRDRHRDIDASTRRERDKQCADIRAVEPRAHGSASSRRRPQAARTAALEQLRRRCRRRPRLRPRRALRSPARGARRRAGQAPRQRASAPPPAVAPIVPVTCSTTRRSPASRNGST